MAAAACAGVLAWRDLDVHARDVVRERATPRPVLLLVRAALRQTQPAHDGGRGHLARLERQLKLLGRLRGRPEPMDAKPGQLVA